MESPAVIKVSMATFVLVTLRMFPRVVSEIIWASWLVGCLIQIVYSTKVNPLKPLPPQRVYNQDNHTSFKITNPTVFCNHTFKDTLQSPCA